MEKENKEEKIRTIVVPELPTQPVSVAEIEGGEKVNLITIGDALTEIYKDIKEIKKGLI